ncbi:hypothetical protein, partial [Burkholderia gladioli]|uniref:hypothetical protein n=1 Tax=Burkholderia gladioli TaxID=28095 RepID=UPI001F30FF2C
RSGGPFRCGRPSPDFRGGIACTPKRRRSRKVEIIVEKALDLPMMGSLILRPLSASAASDR